MKGRRDCDRLVAAGIVAVVAAGMGLAWLPGVFSPAAPSGFGAPGAPAPTAAVTRQEPPSPVFAGSDLAAIFDLPSVHPGILRSGSSSRSPHLTR